MQIPAHQALHDLTRHTSLVTFVDWSKVQKTDVQTSVQAQLGEPCCVWWLLTETGVHTSSVDDEYAAHPSSSITASVMRQIDPVTEVHWNNSICAQFQYSAEVCRTSMQHTWVLDVVGSHAHSL